MLKKIKQLLNGLALFVILITVGVIAWLGFRSTNGRTTDVPSAKIAQDAPLDTNTDVNIELIPTSKLQVPSTIDTAFLAYIRSDSSGKIRVYSSYLEPDETEVYVAWAVGMDGRANKLCELKTTDQFQYSCEQDLALDDGIEYKYVVTRQPSGLLLPGTQYLQQIK